MHTTDPGTHTAILYVGLEAPKSIPMFIYVAAFGDHRQPPAILAEVFY